MARSIHRDGYRVSDSSDPGGGSAHQETSSDSDPTETDTRRILVVDDNRDVADSLGRLLELTGHDVRLTYDGREAIERAGDLRPELILLDISMPEIDGYEVCRQIREQPWGADPFIVAVTGWGQDSDRRQAREAGFDDHVVKPLEPATIDALVASFRR